MNLFQKQQKTSGYKTIPDASAADEETTAVSFGTRVQTSTSRRSLTWRIAIVAGMTMIVMAGGAVLMLQTTDGGLTTTAVERNRDTGYRCCKKTTTTDCVYYGGSDECFPINYYGGDCHVALYTNDCCTDKEHGTLYFAGGCHDPHD